MSVSAPKRLKELEVENARLKKLLAESLLENEVTREKLRTHWRPDPPDALRAGLAVTRGWPRCFGPTTARNRAGATLTRANDRGVMLRLIEPGKPTQNA